MVGLIIAAFQVVDEDLAAHALLPLAGQLHAAGVGLDDEEGGGGHAKIVLPHELARGSVRGWQTENTHLADLLFDL